MNLLDNFRNHILDPHKQLKKEETVLALELTKIVLQASTVALTARAFASPQATLPCLFGAYLCLEGSMVASNGKNILENASLSLITALSKKVFKQQMLKNAPLIRSAWLLAESLPSH